MYDIHLEGLVYFAGLSLTSKGKGGPDNGRCGTGWGLPFRVHVLSSVFLCFRLPYFWRIYCRKWLHFRRSSSIADAFNSVHFFSCTARPPPPLFAVSLRSLLPCKLFSTMILRTDVLRDVLDELQGVIIWCVAIPTHPILCSFIILPVIPQPSDRICFSCGLERTGQRRTPICI